MFGKKIVALLSVASFAVMGSVYAGNIDVSNENKKELKVKIEPEGDSNASFIQQISADQKSSFIINSSQLNGKAYFSIKGDTSAFTSGGKCEHLSVDNDYKVTFQNDKVGTTCIAEEVQKGQGK